MAVSEAEAGVRRTASASFARLNTAVAGGAVVFLAAAGVYGGTLLRGVSSGDPAEMQTVPTVLGISHPTTYPFWTLLGYVWTRIPVASPAVLMNTLSAMLFAASGAVVVLLANRLGARPLLATAIGGGMFVFAGVAWSRATLADVHALHTLLVALALLAWVTAEETGSRKPALALVGLVGLGLAHHRLMLITGVPVVIWLFLRNLGWLRSGTFVTAAAVLGVAPLMLYLYLPFRGVSGTPVVNVNYSNGWLAAATAFRGNQTVWSTTSLGSWLGTLPHYTRLVSQWVGWVPLVVAVLGVVTLLRRRPPVAIGLLWVLLIPTYGVANREGDDVHFRWLIVPVLVLSLFAAVGAEQIARVVLRFLGARSASHAGRAALVVVAAVSLWLLVPTWELARGWSRYDRSAQTGDARSATRILRTLEPRAVVWSDWDFRTSLQYEHLVEKRRRDVDILDHRAYVAYGNKNGDDAAIARAVAADPRYRHRPIYVIPAPGANNREVALLSTRFAVHRVLALADPSEAVDDEGGRFLYRVERSGHKR